MVAYAKPQQRKKGESEQLRGERDQIERGQIVPGLSKVQFLK